MVSPELVIIMIGAVMILISYLFVHPKFSGSDSYKMAKNDLYLKLVMILMPAAIYWGSGYEFSIYFTTLNWFWFNALVCLVMELPIMIWYCKKNNVWASFVKQ